MTPIIDIGTRTRLAPSPTPGRPDLLIGLTGPAGVGKDTVASILERDHGAVTDSFAAPLRSMVQVLACDQGEDFDPADRAGKEHPRASLGGVSPRELLQRFGDAGRAISPDYWVHLLALRCGYTEGSPWHDLIVVTDVRYPEEAGWLRRHRGILIRIQRNSLHPVRQHDSEAYFDQLAPDLDLWNAGTLSDLAFRTATILGRARQLAEWRAANPPVQAPAQEDPQP